MLIGVLWVFVRGPPLAADPLIGSLLVGLLVGFPVAYLFRRLYAEDIDLPRTLRGLPYTVLYLLTFARVAVVSSLDVAYRVLAPAQPIEPEVILIPLRVRTDLGVTVIANSITMTPGSLTLDYDPDQNALYVHVIDGGDPGDIIDPIRGWEDYALDIFDEELSPGASVPDFAVYPPDRTHPVLEKAVSETGDDQNRETEPPTETGMEGGVDPAGEGTIGGDDDGR